MKHVVWSLVPFLVACGGNVYRFDPAPAPQWLQAATARGPGRIDSVGRAPATKNPRRDLELATADATKNVALSFESKVKAASSDWTLSVQSEGGAQEVSVLGSDVTIETEVNVEGSQVQASYRDEATRTQYVQIRVDTGAWVTRVLTRLQDAQRTIDGHGARGRELLDAGQALGALGELTKAYGVAAQAEPDVIVASLLDPRSTARQGFDKAHGQLDEATRRLRERFCVRIDAAGAPGEVLRRSVAEFFARYGLRHEPAGCGSDKTLIVAAQMGTRAVKTERVANRVEHIFEATGTLQVSEPTGQRVSALTVNLPAGAHTVRGSSPEAGQSEALKLSGDTLTRKLRSAVRRAYGPR